MGSGAENEVWSYGEEIFRICRKYMLLRETMRPYLAETMKQAHEKGSPVLRTLFYNFPEDPVAWEITDQFCLGDDILVAPILYENLRERQVYLPKDHSWRDLNSGKVYSGGSSILCPAPLDTIPVFIRDDLHPEISF